MPGTSHGLEARQVAAEIAEHVEYLARTASELQVADPVGSRFADVVGRNDELRRAAELWRRGADRVADVSGAVGGKLGGIDQSWQGADADAFLAHMQRAGLAGNEIVDSMRALSAALDRTAETVLGLVRDMAELVAEGADSISEALVVSANGAQRAREQLAELHRPVREIFESVNEVLCAFARFCADVESGGAGSVEDSGIAPGADESANAAAGAGSTGAAGTAAASGAGAGALGSGGVTSDAVAGADATATSGAASEALEDGGTSRAVEPSEAPPSSGVAPAATGGAVATGGGMVGGMMPMGMMGGMAGGGQQRQNSSRSQARPEDVFGVPEPSTPAVFGESGEQRDTDTDTRSSADPRSSSAGSGDSAGSRDSDDTGAGSSDERRRGATER